MALFGDDDEQTAEEVDPPELEDQPDVDPSGDGEAGEAEPGEEEAPTPEPEDADEAEQSGDDGAGPDDIDVEEALKDLSARMSVLSSNLEGVQESRGDLETKIGDVEERMSRLGSLAEAVSSEYNPFVSENAPSEPSWKPEPEDREAGDDPASGPSPGTGDDEASPPTENSPDPGDGAGPSPAADEPGGTPEPPSTDGAPDPVGPSSPIPPTDPGSLEPGSDPGEPDPREAMPEPTPESPPASRQGEEPDAFEENLLLLEWVGMMLDRVGRAGLMDLLDYYQNLGWLDPGIKDRATRVAIGVEAPDRVGDGHWRGDVDLHRRSLVAIQRLQGERVPAARVDELELDLRRLFRE